MVEPRIGGDASPEQVVRFPARKFEALEPAGASATLQLPECGVGIGERQSPDVREFGDVILGGLDVGICHITDRITRQPGELRVNRRDRRGPAFLGLGSDAGVRLGSAQGNVGCASCVS